MFSREILVKVRRGQMSTPAIPLEGEGGGINVLSCHFFMEGQMSGRAFVRTPKVSPPGSVGLLNDNSECSRNDKFSNVS